MNKKSNSLPEGKLPISVLEPILQSISKGNLVIAPTVGVDVGIVKTAGKYLVSSSDPITGTEKGIGWHAVNVSANDVATSGIMPATLNVVGLFPCTSSVDAIRSVMKEINLAADQLGISVAGGHTEITPELKKAIIVVTCFGTGDRFVTSAGAKADDSIILTKTAGIEGTSILANLEIVQRSLPQSIVTEASKMIEKLSILKEAKLAFKTRRVHAMHDVTEGGVIGAVVETALASDLGFEIERNSIPVERSTQRLCDLLSIDPLKLIGSGALLITCAEKYEEDVSRTLSLNGIQCKKIGRFVRERNHRIVLGTPNEMVSEKEPSIQDELWSTIKKYSSGDR